MNRQTIIGAVAGAVLITGAAAFAGYNAMSRGKYADVISATALTRTVKTPRQVCRDTTVTRQEPVKDKDQIAGSVIGAVVGGVLGNQIGGGKGRDVATVAGAVAGGYAGNKTQEHIQANNTYQATEQQCDTVYDRHEEATGQYAVRYRIGEVEHQVTMDHDPGSRIALPVGEPN